MGYPRSGHTLVAAILNANPNVVCSNQLNIYSANSIDINYIKEYSKKPETWKNTTQIHRVPKKKITVIGDKTGHRTVEILKNNPQRLGMIKASLEIPIKWIHVVRNPYDNLATWSKLNHENKIRNRKKSSIRKELDNVIGKYEDLNATIEKLRRSENVLTVNHEFVITRMHNTLEEICNFLEIDFNPQWRDNVRINTWNKPRITRRRINWTQEQKSKVKSIIDRYKWLNGYVYGGCGKC